MTAKKNSLESDAAILGSTHGGSESTYVLEDQIGRDAAMEQYRKDWKTFNRDNYDSQCSPPRDLHDNPEFYGAPVLKRYVRS
ncbi:MAG: hypothetical protein QGH60_14990 [Phycisphaerae bacterium]|jgi:hypothetical protein|nr:hypothetical protein [Phycisphaerae bacterium]